MIALDTETNGVDFKHGAMPFLVTIKDENDPDPMFWEWDVDPLTRIPEVPPEDCQHIQQVIDAADTIAMQNAKFDYHALAKIGVTLPWDRVRDTLRGGHILASNHKHNLTDMCIEYLGIDIEKYEINVRMAVKACRDLCRRELPLWRIASGDDPSMPSVDPSSKRDEDKPWKNDMWLLRAYCKFAQENGWDYDPEWLTLTSEYANADSVSTLYLYRYMEKEIKARGQWENYLHALKLNPIAAGIEDRGVTMSRENTEAMIEEYSCGVDFAQAECVAIAAAYGHNLELPKGASPNDSIREFFYGSCRITCPRCGTETRVKEWTDGVIDEPPLCKKCAKKGVSIATQVKRNTCLNLPRVYSPKSKSGGPTLDKDALDHYEATLEPGLPLDFIKTLRGMRSRQTAVSYMQSYQRFWIEDEYGFMRLYTNVNPTGTDHTRWASYNPNGQNVSKKENFNLRKCFAPRPDREWWSMDGKNLELRIPAYEAGETDLIAVFDRPNDPPYYGSYHLVVFDALHPALFAKDGKKCKDIYESTWYQWTKNGNFALQYGCGERKADQTYHVQGAYRKIRDRFPNITRLSDKQKDLANRLGYVETIPDRTVCAERGYPILASRTEDGRVSPTTPLNYHVSGTAGQWLNKALIRCDEQIKEWNAEGWDGYIALQIHDEILFDMPRGEGAEPWQTNLDKVKRLKALMEKGGDDIGIPTPVSVEYHAEDWSVGFAIPI